MTWGRFTTAKVLSGDADDENEDGGVKHAQEGIQDDERDERKKTETTDYENERNTIEELKFKGSEDRDGGQEKYEDEG